MTDDPRDQAGAPDEQPAGEQTYGRAELLGTTARTALVRCPCGRRQDFDRGDWQWYGVARCSHCGRGILDHSLLVVSARRARELIRARTPTEGELRALRRVELALRDFLVRYDEQPRWVWSPPTTRLAEEVGPLLKGLDDSRRGRGAQPVVASRRAALRGADAGQGDWVEGDAGAAEGAGDDYYDYYDEEGYDPGEGG